MLVLSRKKNESIRIHDDIVVKVVEIRGDKVRLGIEAPPAVPVDREEVFAAKQRDRGGFNAPIARKPPPPDRAAEAVIRPMEERALP